ncbi:putative ATP-grasp target RiPP [Streptosporangium amethystogenes subsp. fukuiense]|uniref:ATP-grasp target RiPP n=1 Tax=Streptosporangium amethystogenes subsp. fukuiense TaxID=698418 RepID=A0ABW2TCE2_9ACTN
MSKITIDDLPFEGAELTEAELGEVDGGQKWSVSAWKKNLPCEWWQY